MAQNLYGRDECTLGVMPLYHTMGVRSLIAMSLIGGTFVCLPRFDAGQALAVIEAEKITMAATDRYRLAVRELNWQPTTELDVQVLIPARAAVR